MPWTKDCEDVNSDNAEGFGSCEDDAVSLCSLQSNSVKLSDWGAIAIVIGL